MDPFRAAIEAHDIDAVVALLSDDVVLRSPVAHRPYRGREQVGPVLRAVAAVLEDFRYTREYGGADGRDHALVFEARIGDTQIEGCDFLHRASGAAITELTVMVRPLSGAHALADAMRAELAATNHPGGPAPA